MELELEPNLDTGIFPLKQKFLKYYRSFQRSLREINGILNFNKISICLSCFIVETISMITLYTNGSIVCSIAVISLCTYGSFAETIAMISMCTDSFIVETIVMITL